MLTSALVGALAEELVTEIATRAALVGPEMLRPVAVDALFWDIRRQIQETLEALRGAAISDRLEFPFDDIVELVGVMEVEENLPPFEMKRVRSLVIKLTEAVDTFIVRLTLHNAKPAIWRAFHMFRKVAEKMSFEARIREARRALMYLMKGFPAFRRRQMSPEVRGVIPYPRKALSVFTPEEDDMVIRDDEVNKVMKLLTSNSEHLEIISIVGKSGLGKTTLAKKILNHPPIVEEFPARAFCYVSQEYDTREVLLSILNSFTPVTSEIDMTEEKLVGRVRKELESRKYLIIMDDVREREDWDKLKVALSNNKKGSRVLITSRQKYVAAYANPCIKPHYLRFLSTNESLNLLKRRVFAEYVNVPRDLRILAFGIAFMCNGLPLAIRLVAGYLLNNRDSWSWWERGIHSLESCVVGDKVHCQALINWGYNQLASHLKLCFSYLAIFPIGYKIPVKELLRLWIAEGFIQERDMPLEYEAECYLEELVCRNLIVVESTSLDGQIKTCRLPKAMRDFCKGKDTEEREIEVGNYLLNQSLIDHLGIRANLTSLDNISSLSSLKGLRSFLTFTRKGTTWSQEHINCFWKSFMILKVLDIRTFLFSSFPLELCQLVLLKYIALRCSFTIIPSKISSLQNIQTLVVETRQRTLEIRANIWKMTKLRHLQTNASAILPNPGDKSTSIQNLQTLSFISEKFCRRSDVLQMAPKLRTLGIRGKLAFLLEVMDGFGGLCQLQELEKLKLLNDDVNRRTLSFPRNRIFPDKLRKLTLENTLLPWDEMSVLGKLPRLEVLKLKDNAFEGISWNAEAEGFKTLEVLQIGKTNLQDWKASAHHFPVLRYLLLKNCTDLEGIPEEFADIPNLQRIDLYHSNESNPGLNDSARRIQELKHKNDQGTSVFKLFIKRED